MKNGRMMLAVAATVLCLSGLACAATTIDFLDTYDHDGNTATAMIVKPAATYLYFDPNNWSGGAPPQFEGETASVNDWYSYTYDANWTAIPSTQFRVIDLAGGVVDLVGRGYDPGDFKLQRCYGPSYLGGIQFIDTSGGKTSYIKAKVLQIGSAGTYGLDVPFYVDQFLLTYRESLTTTSATVDANTITLGKAKLTINVPATGYVRAGKVEMVRDDSYTLSRGTEPYAPQITINGPVTGLTTVTMAAEMWGDYDANGDGAAGTGTVDIYSGSMTIRTAQTTFPKITLAANCTLAGNLAGATYGAGGKIQFQPGSILGDTVGTNNPSRADANGPTLYKPVVGIGTGVTILSGDDGVGPYKGVGLGTWCDGNSLGGTIQARAASGDLNIAIAGKPLYFDANSTLRGSDTTTANIKVFPGDGLVNLSSGGINGNASGANLITTFNLDGVEGDKSPNKDEIGSDERWIILKTSGTGGILPGQTFKITNGVYQMDVGADANTLQGKLIIGAGGALELRDSTTSEPYTGAGKPIQSSATGHLEVQDRGLVKLTGGDSLGTLTPDQITVSGTPMVCFSRADNGYNPDWGPDITIDAAANPGLQKILDQATIILHSVYRANNTARQSKFLGDGLRIREGGLVTSTWAVNDNFSQAGVHADTVYFGPANKGGTFTIAAGATGIWIYCPVGDGARRASKIYINGTEPIETIVNTGWYPYSVCLGRVVGVPTGNVNFYETIYADELIVRNGTCTLDGASVAAAGVHVIGEDGTVNINNGGASSWANTKITVKPTGYINVAGSTTGLGDVTVYANYVNNVSGLKLNAVTTVAGRLSGDGSWGNNQLRVKAGGTVAPGGNAGADIGKINAVAGNGLQFETDATIEWQVKGTTFGEVGIEWDAIYGNAFNFAVSGTTSTLNFKILNAGLTKDIKATDQIPFVFLTGTTMTLPTTWTIDFDAPAGWDTSGASIVYSNAVQDWDGIAGNDRVLYLTGLVVSLATPGDTNGDKIVNAADFITLKKNFGTSAGAGASAGDFDKSGTVNWADLNILTNNMGATGSAPSTAPEPATLGLLALGAMAVLWRRRRARVRSMDLMD